MEDLFDPDDDSECSLDEALASGEPCLWLDVDKNEVNERLDDVLKLKTVQGICFNGCNERGKSYESLRLPIEIFSLEGLKALTFFCYEQVIFPTGFGFLQNIMSLGFRSAQASDLTSVIREMPLLERYVEGLTHEWGRKGALPDEFFELSHLKHLEFEEVGFDVLPSRIGNLHGLETLKLSWDLVRDLPDELCKLSQLRKLIVEEYGIEMLPSSIGAMESLEELVAFDLPLKKLPDSIGGLKSLKELQVPFTLLSELPESLGDLENLRFLGASNCYPGIIKLPERIGDLQKLERLRLSENRIESVPDSIGKLAGTLRELDLSKNPIANNKRQRERVQALLPKTRILW